MVPHALPQYHDGMVSVASAIIMSSRGVSTFGIAALAPSLRFCRFVAVAEDETQPAAGCLDGAGCEAIGAVAGLSCATHTGKNQFAATTAANCVSPDAVSAGDVAPASGASARNEAADRFYKVTIETSFFTMLFPPRRLEASRSARRRFTRWRSAGGPWPPLPTGC